MVARTASDSTPGLAGYLARVRLRAWCVYGARAACAALGTSLCALVLAALAAGPVASPLLARALLGLALAVTAAAAVTAAWPALRLRGLDSARLVAAREPRIGSALRSALELEHAHAATSAALIAAHARSVSAALARVPASEVVPFGWLRHGSVVAGLSAAALGALVLAGHDGLRLNAHALLDPAQVRADGVRTASLVGAAQVRVVYPSYLGLPETRTPLPALLEAPRGSTVELSLKARIEATQGVLLLGSTALRLAPAPGGDWFARFVVREDAALALRLHDGDQWLEDDAPRRLRAQADQRPRVELHGPARRIVELDEALGLRADASDDHGLEGVELVLQVEGREEQRRMLWSAREREEIKARVEQEVAISAAEAGATPGSLLTLWVEARDGDTISGPNVGVSKSLTFEVATDAQALSLRLPRLREVLDGAIDALADRLEIGMPSAAAQAAVRARELHGPSAAWVDDLQALIRGAGSEERAALDLDQLRGIAERMRRELARESQLHAEAGRPLTAFAAADARMVSEHERDVLILADMLAQGLVDEARGLAKELSALKDRVKELLAELRNNPSPEAERALLAEIAKIERRLRELAQSLSRLSNRVPSEFINREALPQNEAQDALSALQEAVQSGDLAAAAERLEQLGKQLEQLSQQLEQGGARFREAHYGARDRALDQARSQLSMLASEQGRLSERTRDVVQRASDRVSQRTGKSAVSQGLQQAADALAEQTRDLAENPGPEGPFLDRAKERTRDVADALRAGDLAEARDMARQAQNQLEPAAGSLEQDARMFPGHDGKTQRRAEAATRAADGLRDLQRQIDGALPDLAQELSEGERGQLRGDAPAQRSARTKTEEVQRGLGEGAGDEAPLSPGAASGLGQAAEAMQRAEQALDRGDAKQASREQDDARERLRQVAEQLERRGGRGEPRPGERRRNEGGEQDGPEGDGLDSQAHVRIPEASEFRAPKERRRRLLDAMREEAPSEYAPAVQRYYQELLR